MPLLSSVTSRFPSGDQVAAAVKQGKIALVDEGAVGKDREQDVLALACGFDDVAAKKRLTPRQQNKADAEVVRLAEDAEPLLAAELRHRLRVHRCVIAARVAARAVEIALAGDAGDSFFYIAITPGFTSGSWLQSTAAQHGSAAMSAIHRRLFR